MEHARDNTDASGPALPALHLERAVNSVTGMPMYIECECPLGRDHTFEEWLAQLPRTLQF